jgi:hypothetical protein
MIQGQTEVIRDLMAARQIAGCDGFRDVARQSRAIE